jgi:translation initiation factor IF-2
MKWQLDIHSDNDLLYLGWAVVRRTAAPTEIDSAVRCYVSRGILTRSALIRVIRDGQVVFPPPGQTAALDVLKRATSGKDREEVGEGFDCIVRVIGFDALLKGDVVEAYLVRPRL